MGVACVGFDPVTTPIGLDLFLYFANLFLQFLCSLISLNFPRFSFKFPIFYFWCPFASFGPFGRRHCRRLYNTMKFRSFKIDHNSRVFHPPQNYYRNSKGLGPGRVCSPRIQTGLVTSALTTRQPIVNQYSKIRSECRRREKTKYILSTFCCLLLPTLIFDLIWHPFQIPKWKTNQFLLL